MKRKSTKQPKTVVKVDGEEDEVVRATLYNIRSHYLLISAIVRGR